MIQHLTLDEITGVIVDEAVKLHKRAGPGMYESVYEAILAHRLQARGLSVLRQHPVRLDYDGLQFNEAFRVDLLVEHRVIVEIKSVERCAPVHSKQLLTYLRLMDLRIGLLLNFGLPTLKEGIVRVAN